MCLGRRLSRPMRQRNDSDHMNTTPRRGFAASSEWDPASVWLAGRSMQQGEIVHTEAPRLWQSKGRFGDWPSFRTLVDQLLPWRLEVPWRHCA